MVSTTCVHILLLNYVNASVIDHLASVLRRIINYLGAAVVRGSHFTATLERSWVQSPGWAKNL